MPVVLKANIAASSPKKAYNAVDRYIRNAQGGPSESVGFGSLPPINEDASTILQMMYEKAEAEIETINEAARSIVEGSTKAFLPRYLKAIDDPNTHGWAKAANTGVAGLTDIVAAPTELMSMAMSWSLLKKLLGPPTKAALKYGAAPASVMLQKELASSTAADSIPSDELTALQQLTDDSRISDMLKWDIGPAPLDWSEYDNMSGYDFTPHQPSTPIRRRVPNRISDISPNLSWEDFQALGLDE